MSKIATSIPIICLESDALHFLVNEVVNRIKAEQGIDLDRWISDEEAMKLLRINSKTTLQKFRDDGKVRFSQPSRKVILYDRNSILDLLDKNAKNTF